MNKGKEYIVISPFRDSKDKNKQFPNGKVYAIGDVYFNEERIDELSTDKNKLKKPLIKVNNNLEGLTVKKLKELAKERNVKSYSTMKKEELIEAIEGE